MKIIVLQHVRVEHPGIFREFMRSDGLDWDTIELDEGQSIPDLESYDLMMVMGGPQDVWQEAEFPWLADEKRAIRHFVGTLARPFLGVCLGHQLLADSMGGSVGLAKIPEVGILSVKQTETGRRDALLSRFPDPATVLQWHGAEVLEAPPRSLVLASSERCAIQALRYGDCAYGIQFHVEATCETVSDWAAIPVYAAALEKSLGAGGATALKSQVEEHLPRFNKAARAIYDGLMAQVAATRLRRLL
jgi:GMP synthase-like glutamine amidotransferase